MTRGIRMEPEERAASRFAIEKAYRMAREARCEAEGVCLQCRKPLGRGKRLCDVCLAKQSKYAMRGYVHKTGKAHRCGECGEPGHKRNTCARRQGAA